MLGHKSRLNKYRKIEITACTLSDYNEINLDFFKLKKYTNSKRLHNILLNDG